MKNQEIKSFTTSGKQEVRMTKNFSKNYKMKFGNLEQNITKHIIDFLHFGTNRTNKIRW